MDRKWMIVGLVTVLLALVLFLAVFWPNSPHTMNVTFPNSPHTMSVTFYTGDPAAPQTSLQTQSLAWLTVTVQGASPNTLFTWALYERALGSYQWIFVEGTGSTNVVAPDSTDENGYRSWKIGVFAASHYEMPSTPGPIYGWPTGQYQIKVTVTSPAPATSNSVTEESNIVTLQITQS